MENSGNFKRLEKKAITQTATDNLKLWLVSFFDSVCDVMPMCENKNGETSHHLPSWFRIDFMLNVYIKDMEGSNKGMLYCTCFTFKSFEENIFLSIFPSQIYGMLSLLSITGKLYYIYQLFHLFVNTLFD